MLDRVLLGQQQITVDFNGKIDSAYNNLNTKIETLGKNRVAKTLLLSLWWELD